MFYYQYFIIVAHMQKKKKIRHKENYATHGK